MTPTKDELDDAVDFARDRLQRAEDAYLDGGRTLALLRARQVAEDEYRQIVAERHQFDDDRDVRVLYRAERFSSRRLMRR